jgi:transcriptional regulator GlxA family with amidase domain
MRYLRRLRLAPAAGLLRDTNLPLAAIACRTGYDSEVSLGKAFKREYGVPPGRYRLRQDEPIVTAPVSWPPASGSQLTK